MVVTGLDFSGTTSESLGLGCREIPIPILVSLLVSILVPGDTGYIPSSRVNKSVSCRRLSLMFRHELDVPLYRSDPVLCLSIRVSIFVP